MANDLLVRILGDTRGLERSFAKANQATATFGRNVETTGTKLDNTSRKFSSFARGAATGFGGAIALNATIDGIRTIALAAAESQQVLGQTRVALETTGKSWEDYGRTIEDTVAAQSRLGFDDEALLRTFSLFVRTTGEVNEALRLNSLAMDVARARFIDLEQAAQLVNKAAIGQGGALRRLGIDVKANASATELLAALTAKYGGAAEAASDDASTSFERTQVAMENLQESLGTLLLPALELLADRLQTAAEFATNLTDALRRIGAVKVPEVELPFNVTIGGQSVGDLAGRAFNIAKFTPLNPLFSLTVANAIANQFRDQSEDATVVNELANGFARSVNTLTQNALDIAGREVAKAKPRVPSFGQPGFKALAENTAGADAKREFQDALDSLNLNFDKAEATEGVQDDLDTLATLEKLIRQRIAAQGKTTDLMRLLFNVDQQRAAVLKGAQAEAEAAREATKRSLEKIRDERREIAERAKEALQEREFRAIGLSATGGEVIPGLENLRKQFDQLSKNVVGEDVPRKLRDRLKLVGKFLRSGIKSAEEPTRQAINELFRTIRAEFDKEDKKGPLTRTQSLNTNRILDGLGLGADAERELRARLSSFNSAGRALGGATRPTGGFAPATVVVENHNTTTLDGKVVAANVTKSQQKGRRRNPRQKRGPNSRSGF